MTRETARASESPTALDAQRIVGLSPASPTGFGPAMNEEPRSNKEHDNEAQHDDHHRGRGVAG